MERRGKLSETVRGHPDAGETIPEEAERSTAQRVALAGGWAFLALCGLALLARLAQGGPLTYRFFNSDALYLVALYTDLFVDGGHWRGWQPTAAPFYFPDVPFYFLLYPVLGSFEAANLVYGFTQYALLLVALRAVLTELLGSRSRDASTLYVGGAVLLLLTSGRFDFLVFGLLPNYHISALLFGLWGFLGLRRFERSGRSRDLALLLGGTLLFSASDRLTLVSFLVPACVYVVLWGRFPRRLRLLAALGGAAALGVGLYFADALWLHDYGIESARRRAGAFRFDRLGELLAAEPWLALVMGLGALFHLALLASWRRLDRGAAGYLLLGNACVLAATPIVISKGDLLVHQRYFLIVWLLGLVGWIPLLRSFALPRPAASVRLVAAAAGGAALLPLVLIGLFATGPRGGDVEGWRFYPRITRCIDDFLERRGATRVTGIADYWFARMIQHTTRRDLHMVVVTPTLGTFAATQGRTAYRRAEASGGFALALTWRTRASALRELRRPDRHFVCTDVPNPKEGRPILREVTGWFYDTPQPLPWTSPKGRPAQERRRASSLRNSS